MRARLALVAGKLAPPHAGPLALVDHARAAADRVVVVLWANPDLRLMAGPVRAGWLRALRPDLLVLAPEGPPDAAPGRVHRRFLRDLLRARGLRPDLVASGEPYGPRLARAPGAAHLALDRRRLPASGAALRADPLVLAALRAALRAGGSLDDRDLSGDARWPPRRPPPPAATGA